MSERPDTIQLGYPVQAPEVTWVPDSHTKRNGVPDALWPTDNEWDVPALNLHWQANAVDLPVCRWGAVRRSAEMRGTWHFYTDDYKFQALWHDPSPVVNTGCVNVVEPNFSTNEQMPKAVLLWRVYQKRWLARYWQSRGVRVFVDLNVTPACSQLNLLGVPQGWKAWATRGRASEVNLTLDDYRIACEHAGTADILFLVYGGGLDHRALAKEHSWVWVPEDADSVRGRYQDG